MLPCSALCSVSLTPAHRPRNACAHRPPLTRTTPTHLNATETNCYVTVKMLQTLLPLENLSLSLSLTHTHTNTLLFIESGA